MKKIIGGAAGTGITTINPHAEWIWPSIEPATYTEAYFSTRILHKDPVPEPVTILSAEINMDNRFDVYISETPDEAGIRFGEGDDWQTTGEFATGLQEGVDYYLHVYGYNNPGYVGGFLGEFSLEGFDHYFEATNSTNLLTNTDGWLGSLDGWGINTTDVVSMGENYENNYWNSAGTGIAAIDPLAQWIWTSTTPDIDNNAFFSTRIIAGSVPVPEPSAMIIYGIGLVGLVGTRIRMKKA